MTPCQFGGENIYAKRAKIAKQKNRRANSWRQENKSYKGSNATFKHIRKVAA
jgi:hypothetical protein